MAYDFYNPNPQPQQFNYLDSLAGLSAPEPPPLNVPFSPVSANGTLPVAGPSTGIMGSLGKLGGWMGKNGQTVGAWANVIGQGLQAYLGLQQLGMAKDALNFEKKSFKANFRNSAQAYNTQMQDRITGRYYATEEERQKALQDAQVSETLKG